MKKWVLTPRASGTHAEGLTPLRVADLYVGTLYGTQPVVQAVDGVRASAAVPVTSLLDTITFDTEASMWAPRSTVNGAQVQTVLDAVRDALQLPVYVVGAHFWMREEPPGHFTPDGKPEFELHYPAWGLSIDLLRVWYPRYAGSSYAIPATNLAQHPLIRKYRMGVQSIEEAIAKVLMREPSLRAGRVPTW